MSSSIPLLDFAIALFIGALVGIDRERKKTDDRDAGIGGIRTFILFAMAGAISAWLSDQWSTPWIFIVTGMGVTLIVLAGYQMHSRATPGAYGLTTEIAAIVVYLLGGVVLFGHKSLGVALAIATSAVLAFKQPIHGVVRRLGQEDIYAGLKLLIATFIVLPVLPNHTIDPWAALNPYKMWWLVILLAGLSLVGYVATRILGAERGIPLTGLFGGLVSSTAVSLAFARRSREEASAAGLADALAAGLLLAWVVMFVRILAIVGVVCRALLPPLIAPMGVMGLLTLAIAAVCWRRSVAAARLHRPGEVPLKNPFSLTGAAKFALLLVSILLLVQLARHYLPGQGVYWVAAVAGLADVDAITLSMADMVKSGGTAQRAAAAITIAVLSNTVVKCLLVAVAGTRSLLRPVVIATIAIALGAVITLWIG